jgi:hypothetical protein
VASPRTFNLVVSNIPGPAVPLYMNGCRLVEAYPVVPLADRHALSIGVTTVTGRACFGIYADRRSLPDADLIAHELDREINQLLRRSPDDHQRPRLGSSRERPPRPAAPSSRSTPHQA